MTISRRKFVKNTSLTLTALPLFKASLYAVTPKQLTGIQLYSIRDDMKIDPLGTLAKLSEMGYTNVEHANYSKRTFYGYKPKEFKKILGDLGISMPSGHTVFKKEHWNERNKDFSDQWKYTVEDAATMGQEFVISPSLDEDIRKDKEAFMRFMEVFNKNGELCAVSGMKFGYHNHHFEFMEKVGDELLYDAILRNTDPKLVTQQLDIGNMYNGGAKAIDILKKYPGRFASLHVKDEIKSEGGRLPFESTILGTGVIGVKEVIDYAKKKGGSKHFIIEVESYQGMAPLESVELCLNQMKEWGY